MGVLAFDTSNYTTSIAYLSQTDAVNCSQLLPVKAGELGLRQSDAVFHHVHSLPELSDRLFSQLSDNSVHAVGVSTRPRAVEGSYMPCFLVGYSHAKLIADAYKVPLFTFSHQQGHVAAALWSAGHLELMDVPHLAWHLSGGTTELLLVEPDHNRNVTCTRIGGTTDISAGQLIDRTGQLLNLPFPAGKHIDLLSRDAINTDSFKVKCNGTDFSLSGVQNKVQQYYAKCDSPMETAAYALRCVMNAIIAATQNAQKAYPGLPVVFSGGVASNSMLRDATKPFAPIFAQPQFSTDNAMGVAVLTQRMLED